jgi:hypothetical protein
MKKKRRENENQNGKRKNKTKEDRMKVGKLEYRNKGQRERK